MNENEAKAKSILLKMGVKDFSKGEGLISLPMRAADPQIISYERYDTTPLPLAFRPNVTGRVLNRLDNRIQSGALLDIFKQPCVKFKDPNIDYTLFPLKLANITYHALSFYLEGDIINKITNKCQEGEKGITSTWIWKNCPVESNEYSWAKVTGSADLSSSWSHKILDDVTGATLGKFNQNRSVSVGSSSSINAHWKSGNLIDLILQIINIILTGGITTRNGYDVSYSWSFNGTHTKTQHIDAKIWLPISGGLTWIWD